MTTTLQKLDPYLRLMRLHQPAGIMLLLWPCWWALALASKGMPSLWQMLLFALGAVAMRGAGCAYNDIVDRDFDREVERTRSRPLASGELTVMQAWMLIGALLIFSAFVALLLPSLVFLLALLSLALVATYPFMKRFTWWPQAFLGLTFNWGVFMGWAAAAESVGWGAFPLYLGGIAWTLGYDTIYAHQDKEDDARIGVKSSALRLGGKTLQGVALFYSVAVVCWALAGISGGGGMVYYIGLMALAVQLGWQVKTLRIDHPQNCLDQFKSNMWAGALLFVGALFVNN